MNFLEAAERYVALGFKVLPLKVESKEPLTENGVYDATDDMDVLACYVRNHRDANIAVGCGPASGQVGLTAIDVDKHKGGVDTMQSLLRKHAALPACPMSRTPQGGYHMLFCHEAGIANSQNVLGKGIDVKTKGGYVVLPPSHWDGMKKGKRVCDGGSYLWVRPPLGSHLPAMPQWMLKILLPKPMPKFAPKQWDKSNTNLAQVAKALKSISNHDYWTWTRIGMAIKSEFGDAAFDVWCNWSSEYAGFSEAECAKKWRSFKRTSGNCVRLGTVIREALMGGADRAIFNERGAR
jgi:hypothetical protein